MRPAPARIGIDAACWANGRGYGRFTRELCRALVAAAPEREFVFFADAAAAAKFDIAGPNIEVSRVDQRVSPTVAAAADAFRSPIDMWRWTRAVGRERLDVFLSPSVYTYFPLPLRLPAVVTIHDAIAERFPELTLPSRRSRLFWRMKVRLAIAQSRLILTVSDFAAREIVEMLGVSPDRLRVTSEAASAVYRPAAPHEIAMAAARVGLPAGARWFAYVGGFNPHKNVDVIVRAHASVAAAAVSAGLEPPRLLLVGSRTADVFHGAGERIDAAIAASGTASLIDWLGFVVDEELRKLVAGAQALLLPSENEGFGLPAVEAAACGTPVVATTASPLPRLLAGGGLFVAPRDQQGLEAAMTLLCDDKCRAAMGRRARECAARLTWEAAAASVLDALDEAASGRRAGTPELVVA
jgi:glycosyltransferase involved in cell wall biosynthesis